MANATRSTTTDAEAAGSSPSTDEYCPCQRAFSRLNRTHHDWLLKLEERGLVGVVELFAYAENSAEHGLESGTLPWVDLPQFMAMHRWEHPADVYDLVGIIDQMVRYHQGRMPRDQSDDSTDCTAAAVDSLRSELDQLRQQLATEVRTRRLVVVDPNGFERIVAKTSSDSGSLTVASARDVHVSLTANEQSLEAYAEVYLSGGGNVAGHFGVTEDGESNGEEIDPDSLYYRSELTLIPDDGDPRFHAITLDREGLHYGG